MLSSISSKRQSLTVSISYLTELFVLPADGQDKAIQGNCLIYFYSPEKNAVIKFITNNFNLEASTIALLYKYRWQIELFFRWIKQHLRITSFFGTSGNAVMSQIYIALITFCILALAADQIGHKGSIYEFSNIMSVSLTEQTMLRDLMKRYNKEPEDNIGFEWPSLFDFDFVPDTYPR